MSVGRPRTVRPLLGGASPGLKHTYSWVPFDFESILCNHALHSESVKHSIGSPCWRIRARLGGFVHHPPWRLAGVWSASCRRSSTWHVGTWVSTPFVTPADRDSQVFPHGSPSLGKSNPPRILIFPSHSLSRLTSEPAPVVRRLPSDCLTLRRDRRSRSLA